MKTTIVFLAASLFSNFLVAQFAAIPDTNFEKTLIKLGYDSGVPDGRVLTNKIDTIKVLDVSFNNISSLKGIENFKSLTDLNCYENKLENLDISQNIALTNVVCGSNQLTNLDLSQNIALTTLNCNSNQLTNLDLSRNIALIKVVCTNNQLIGLDFSQNKALKAVYCFNNEISNLRLDENFELTKLNCAVNKLKSLVLPVNGKLKELDCGGNDLKNLDVSQNVTLTHLYCWYNQLKSLDVSQNKSLFELYCDSNEINSLDVSQNKVLTHLNCTFNKLKSLDLSQNRWLHVLDCYNNDLNCLNLKHDYDTNLSRLVAYNNPNLSCIEVRDVNYFTSPTGPIWFSVDSGTTFSTSCANKCFVGIDNLEPEIKFSIYPNPTYGIVNVKLEGYNSTFKTTLRNSLGQVIQAQYFEVSEDIKINIEAPAGLYFLNLESSTGTSKTIKVIKE